MITQSSNNMLFAFFLITKITTHASNEFTVVSCSNGAGGSFSCNSGMSNQDIAHGACLSVYGSCSAGSCGSYYYYYGSGHLSCDCSKVAGQYEFIYSNTGYTTVGADYGGQNTDVSGNNLFVRRKASSSCNDNSWELTLADLGSTVRLAYVESETCQWHEMNKMNKIINGQNFFGFECPPHQIISELRLKRHVDGTVLDNNPTAILCCELGGYSSVTNTCSDFYSSDDGHLESAACEGNSAFAALYDVVDPTLDQSEWQYQATKGLTCCDIDYDTDYGRNLDFGIDRNLCETVSHDISLTGFFNVACPDNMVLVEIKDNDIAHGVQKVHQIECCRVHNAAAPTKAPTIAPTTSEPSPAPTTSCYDCLLNVHERQLTDKDDFVGEVEDCLSYCCS